MTMSSSRGTTICSSISTANPSAPGSTRSRRAGRGSSDWRAAGFSISLSRGRSLNALMFRTPTRAKIW